jgi:archaellum component FlaC
MKIIDKLSTYAALIGTISVIGGGFYAWGEFNTRLSAIEGTPAVNLQPLQNKDKELTTTINDNKIDLIDRIKKVEDKIQPVDLTTVFKEIGKVREEVAMINIPNIDGIKKDIKEINTIITRIEKKLAILEKEKEVLAIEIEEIKLESNNPLSN